MKTVRLLATNTLAQLLGKAATVLSTMLIGRMISSPDGLGKAGFDEYAIIITYAAYFYIITDFGFNAIATKDITEDKQKSTSYISNILGLRLVMSIGLIMLGLAILSFIPSYSNSVKLGIIFMLITIISQAIFTNGNILFQSRLRYVQSTLAVIAGSLTSLSAAYIVFVTGGNLYAYLFAIILGSAVMATVSLIQVRASLPISIKFDWQLWRYIIFAAFPLGMTIVFNLIYVRSGFFVLSLFDQEHYGIYTMAYRVFDAVLVLPVFVVNALYPIMVGRLQQGKQQFIALIKKSLLGMVGLSLIVIVAIWVLAPVAIWFSTSNPAFNESIQVLRWLSLLVPIFFMSNILLWTLIALGRRRLLILFYGIGAVVSVGLNIWLIPQYGYIAAIIITGIVETLVSALMAVQVWLILQSNSTSNPELNNPTEGLNAEIVQESEAIGHV